MEDRIGGYIVEWIGNVWGVEWALVGMGWVLKCKQVNLRVVSLVYI